MPTRPPRTRAAAWFIGCALALSWVGAAISVVAAVITVTEAPDRALAADLTRGGTPATARVDPDTGEVTFTAGGTHVTVTERAGTVSDPDAADVPVVYDPADPRRALTVDDLTYLTQDSLAGGLSMTGLGLLPGTIMVVVWLACGRPSWGRYLPSSVGDLLAVPVPD